MCNLKTGNFKMVDILHNGTKGERMTQRKEPYYLARNKCKVFINEIKTGDPVYMYYLPVEEYQGNAIKTSPVVHYEFNRHRLLIETENSIFILERSVTY